jgi:hypothetical protein
LKFDGEVLDAGDFFSPLRVLTIDLLAIDARRRVILEQS